LEGTVIHKSGLITGGRSSHAANKRWNEKDVDGELSRKGSTSCLVNLLPLGLIRTRDSLLAEQRELSKQKPRGKTDEALISEISRQESDITVAKDDLVSSDLVISKQFANKSYRQRACKLRINGIKEELKHIDRELKNLSPESKKVSFCSIKGILTYLSEGQNCTQNATREDC